MKTFLRVLGLLFVGVAAYLILHKPEQRPPSSGTIERSPQRIARGKYLVHHVSICFDCHSDRTDAYALPFKPGREGVGGFVWDEKIGFPGVLAASNLTPDPQTGLGRWTDGEILRAIREGVDRNGNALFPIMPYGHYRHMSDEDAKSIVAYLRTLAPQRYERPKKALNMPLPLVEKFMPEPVSAPVPEPDRRDRVAYGKYLATIAACGDCHTPKDSRGNPIPGQEFAGGFEMHTPTFRVVTSNITPHPSTFVGRATKEEFIGRFRAFASFTAANAPAAPQGRNTLMPWIAYSGMTDEDLGAIYDYLRTLPPVARQVNPFPDAP